MTSVNVHKDSTRPVVHDRRNIKKVFESAGHFDDHLINSTRCCSSIAALRLLDYRSAADACSSSGNWHSTPLPTPAVISYILLPFRILRPGAALSAWLLKTPALRIRQPRSYYSYSLDVLSPSLATATRLSRPSTLRRLLR